MTTTFLDASFLLALASPRDELHRRAVIWRMALPGPFVTTEFVLLELADGLATRQRVDAAAMVIDSLRRARSTEIVAAESQWVTKGYTLFRQRADKSWGLTDCISFCVMNERGIKDALTHDRHFEQAGFRALLREEPPSN